MLLKVLFAAATLGVVAGGDSFSRDDFPLDFSFGAGTSAYQVEGAADKEGRTPSIFDSYAHSVNMTGAYGDIASDQYHKYKEDVALMATMGLNAYRFSISWSRLIPNGRGPVNPKGLEYYNSLINELIRHEIQPHVTLHHHDLPQALEDEYEGWLSRRSVEDFKAYADLCFREFGDRVKYWTTFNEPNAFVLMGYDLGLGQPQRCTPSLVANCSRGNSSTEPYIAAHHLLLAHASAATLYKKKYQNKQHGFIGINIYAIGISPLTNTTEDISAAQRAKDFHIGWILNPLLFGAYPDIMKKNVGLRLPSYTKMESNLLKGSIDFIGINYYYTLYVKSNPESLQVENRDFLADTAVEFTTVPMDPSTLEFPSTPWGLQRLLELLKHDYGNLPIYIHENGQQTRRNSSLDDWSRVKYLHAHVRAVLDSHRNGVNVKGFFVWSFLDLLEYLTGYESTFGLYHVDLNDPNLRRQPRLSAKWYSHFLHRTMDPKVAAELEKNAHEPSCPLSLHNSA